ncbi:MAG: DUF6382 domain-containing protein [Clostridia bacterium]|nr:DUF6382 domain-containing protein [Clostridia bacterium]
MEISYRREAKRNYLVAGMAETTAGYEARMLAHNEIRGLLRMYITYQDGQASYCYDITSRQPLSRLLETRFITGDEICQLLIQIHTALNGMEEYLLDAGGVLLEPEYIYVEPELFQTGLCLAPGAQGDFQENLSRLLQYILKRINHKDRECVVLAYGLYQESLKENCGMDDLLGLIASERRKGKKTELLRPPEGDLVEREGAQVRQNWEKEQRGEEAREQGKEADTGQGSKKGGEIKREPCEERGKNREKKVRDKPGKAEKTQERPGRTESEWKGPSFIRQFVLWLSAAVLCPSLLWMFKGMTAVFDNWKLLAAIDGGLLVLLSAMNIYGLFMRHRIENGGETDSGEEQDPWRILYEDEEEEDLDIQPAQTPLAQAYKNGDKNESSQKNPQISAEESFQTVLLSERPGEGEEVRRLSALNGSDEDIVISYFPFVIGKHKDLADYVLLKDTVSRFHIRLDEDNGHYTVTDLNSTNGTRVRGRLLEANETTQLEPGDQIFMADCGYIFY